MPDGGKIRIALDYRLVFALDRTHELESNTNAGKILVRIAAVILLWVNDRDRIGYRLLAALVVIGDDQIDSDQACILCFLGCRYAAINADDEADAFLVQTVDRGVIKSIALSDAVGDIRIALKAAASQPIGQQAGRCYTVNVIIAVNGDRLVLEMALLLRSTALSISLSSIGSRKSSRAAVKEAFGLLNAAYPTHAEHRRKQRRIAGSSKHFQLICRTFFNFPFTVIHLQTLLQYNFYL